MQPPMMTVENAVQNALEAALQPAFMQLINESHLHVGHREAGGGMDTHYRLRIRSDALSGLSKVAQHRLVYQALQQWMPHPIHALAIEVLP